VREVCERHGFSDTTFYKWRRRLAVREPLAMEFGRIRGLEEENSHLRKLLAQAMLDMEALRSPLRRKR